MKLSPLKDVLNADLNAHLLNESKENEITYEKAWMNIGVILLIVLGIVQKSFNMCKFRLNLSLQF